MVTNNDIIMIVDTIALFFLGFYARRNSKRGYIVALWTLAIASMISVVMNGIRTYVDISSNVSPYEVTVAIIYNVFFCGLGFIAGGVVIVREKDIGVRIIETKKLEDWRRDFEAPDKCKNVRNTFIVCAVSIKSSSLYGKNSGDEFNRDMRLHLTNALENCTCDDKEKCREDIIATVDHGCNIS